MNRRLAVIAASILAIAPAQAQLAPADSVRQRAEIAAALLEFEWNYVKPLSFRIGRASAAIPDSLVPPAFRILGGTGESNAILESQRESAEARRIVNDHLLAKGLRVNEPWQSREEGFVFGTRSIGSAGRPSTEYCFGPDLITVTVRPQFPDRGAGSMVQYRHRSNYPPCASGYPTSFQRLTGFDEPTLEMPILRPPPGASSNGSGMRGGGGGGGYQRTASAEVRSEMNTRDIILFYAAQLAEQGWTVAEPAIVPDAAIVSARKKDKEGRDLQGVLADVRSPQGVHYFTFQIDRAEPPRGRRP